MISEPEIVAVPLGDECELLVLASDGVWDVMSNQQAVRVVARAARGRSPEEASAELVSVALAGLASARRKDNVTALVVLFDDSRGASPTVNASAAPPSAPSTAS